MTLFDCSITILRLANVPVADFNDLSCDPYIQASLSIDTPDPQVLTYRTHTCRRSLNPHFNAHWIVAGIPQSGFLLSLRLRDEDPGNYDDDLAKTVVRFPQLNDAAGNELNEGWDSGDREYKVHKRKGSVMSQIFTWTARAVTKGDVGHRVRIWVSVKVLQKSENQQDTRLYTVGPRTSLPSHSLSMPHIHYQLNTSVTFLPSSENSSDPPTHPTHPTTHPTSSPARSSPTESSSQAPYRPPSVTATSALPPL